MRRQTTTSRRGSAAVLAMSFLILISCLAVGFYYTVVQSVEVAASERRINSAQLAAESGLQFIKYQLASTNIPSGTSDADMPAALLTSLQAKLDNTANLGASHVTRSGNVITIPPITADPSGGGTKFSGTLEWVPVASPGPSYLRATVTGGTGSGTSLVTRKLRLDYLARQKTSGVFDYGVATKGTISLTGNARIAGSPEVSYGSVLSTSGSSTPLVSTGNTTITGHVSFTNPSANVSSSGNISIGGSSIPAVWNANYVHRGVDEPEFPTFDASPFEPYATNLITSNPNGGNKTYSNIRIKAGVNPSFSGNTTITGVMFIETPNRVTFSGNLTVQGVIVAQNNPTGTLSTNQLTFSGNVTASGPETLPSSYGNLRSLTGTFLLAPNFALSMSGNFGTVGGSIVAGQMTFSGNAGGTVRGWVLNTTSAPVSITGNAGVTIQRPSGGGNPSGWNFASSFKPDPTTYAEIGP